MKRIFLPCVAALLLMGGAAHAQWTGFYVGGNAGYSFSGWPTTSNQAIFDFESTRANPDVNGAIGGGQIGYNIQVGSWVWGFQADLQASGQKDSQTWTDPGLPPPIIRVPVPSDFVPRCCGPAQLSSSWALPWFATFMVRGGILVAPNWLLYITGGLAIGEVKYRFSFSQPGSAVIPAPTNYSLAVNDTRTGGAIGVGSEFKFAPNWSFRVEYLYVDLGRVSISTTDIDGAPFQVNIRARDNVIRVALNYLFVLP